MTKYRLTGSTYGIYRLEYKWWRGVISWSWLTVRTFQCEPSDTEIREAIVSHEESEREVRKVRRFTARYFRSQLYADIDHPTELRITEPKANVKL